MHASVIKHSSLRRILLWYFLKTCSKTGRNILLGTDIEDILKDPNLTSRDENYGVQNKKYTAWHE